MQQRQLDQKHQRHNIMTRHLPQYLGYPSAMATGQWIEESGWRMCPRRCPLVRFQCPIYGFMDLKVRIVVAIFGQARPFSELYCLISNERSILDPEGLELSLLTPYGQPQ